MNNIKSENAKRWLRLSVTHRDSPIGKDHENFIPHSDVIRAVELAEQDAEERVLSVVAEWLKKTYHDFAVDEDFIPEIKQLLNGGQSDEQ